jgi:hypothetical protein
MRRLPDIESRQETELSRMADFEVWGEAAEPALNLEPGEFAEAIRANRELATQVALESIAVVGALLKLLDGSKMPLEETAEDLLSLLCGQEPNSKAIPGWPKGGNVLSQVLKRIAPNLRSIGIVATRDTVGRDRAKRKIWRIERAGTLAAKT